MAVVKSADHNFLLEYSRIRPRSEVYRKVELVFDDLMNPQGILFLIDPVSI